LSLTNTKPQALDIVLYDGVISVEEGDRISLRAIGLLATAKIGKWIIILWVRL